MKDARERAVKTIEACDDIYGNMDQLSDSIAQALEDAYRAGMLRAAEIAETEMQNTVRTPGWGTACDIATAIRAEAGNGERG